MQMSWGKADIHIHTTHSDGNNTVDEVLEYVAQQCDFKVLAITDHDTIAGALAARNLAAYYGVEVIIGEEVSTREGHLLALFLEQELPAGQPAATTIAAIHAQGGICIAAHPYDWMVPSLGHAGMQQNCSGLDPMWALDGIETFNASLWLQSNNARAAAAAVELGLAACGGSDSHHLATIGRGYTRFPGRSAADLYNALRLGQTRADGAFWGWPEVATATSGILRRALEGRFRRTVKPSTP